jgi:hypothetical protein
MLAAVAVALAIGGYAAASYEILGYMALAGAAEAARGRVSRRVVFVAAACVLGTLGFSSLYAGTVSSLRWQAPGGGEHFDPRLGGPELRGGPDGAVTVFRRWRAIQPVEVLAVDGAITLVHGVPGRDWYVGPAGALSLTAHDGYTLLGFSGSGQYAYHSAFLDAPVGQGEFLAAVDIRSQDRVPACGFVALGEHGTGPKVLERVCVGAEWSVVEVTWRSGSASAERRLDVVLSNFDRPVRVRSAEIWALRDRIRQPLGVLAPTNATIRISWDLARPTLENSSHEVRVVVPLKEGRASTFRLEADASVRAGADIWASVHLEDGLTAVMAPFQLESRAIAVPAPYPSRQGLWFGHPNRLGHATAAVFAAAFVSAPTTLAALAVGMAAAPSLILSGSRTALAASVAGILVVIVLQVAHGRAQGVSGGGVGRLGARVLRTTRRQRGPVLAALSIAAVLVLGWQLLSLIGGRPLELDEPSFGTRIGIWRHALSLIPDSPLEYPERDFEASWQSAHGGQPNATHAHNGLLDAMLRFGPVGFVVLAAALVVLLWSRRRLAGPAGVAFVVFAVLNTTDVAYLSWWVIVPLIALALID